MSRFIKFYFKEKFFFDHFVVNKLASLELACWSPIQG